MKKEDIDSEVFELLDKYDQDRLVGRDGYNSSILMSIFQRSQIIDFDTGKRTKIFDIDTKIKQKIIDSIIKGFPDISDKTQEEKANIFRDWRHTAHINDEFEYDLKNHDSLNHLLNSENIEYGLKLAEFLAQKTMEIADSDSLFSIKRAVRGFMLYNWDQFK